jgi:hypothetical protein
MEQCPYEFNFDPQTFKIGDLVSYRIPERFGEMAFVGTITAVGDNHIELSDNDLRQPSIMRATRTARPVVAATEIAV